MAIRLTRSPILPSEGFVHGFPERTGGVSTGLRASLNLGARWGDDRDNVEANRRLVAAHAGYDPAALVATLVMLVGNLVQIMLWGGLFLWLGEFEQAYDAIYHSAVNFSSLGYGDIVMSRERRLLGPLEAVNGVLMLGMSAATLMAIVQHMITLLREAYGIPEER
jgi:hypothetical protein